ncbi:hypothetical protein M569_01698, partial [Genlisea aurea]
EPKSVLELKGSPKLDSDRRFEVETLQLEDHLEVDDWGSCWMGELGLLKDDEEEEEEEEDDDSGFSKCFPAENRQIVYEFPASFDSEQFPGADFEFSPGYGGAVGSLEGFAGDLVAGNWNVGLDYVDDLIRLAECFDGDSLQVREVILGRLNERLRSPAGKPLQRAAFYFKEAIQSILTAMAPAVRRAAGSSEIVQTIKAQNIFSSISPIVMFSGFTATQALLEAIDGGGGAMQVHVVDFDVGFGGHWPAFIKEMAEKANSEKNAPPLIRISAVVAEEYAAESNLVRQNLTQFAGDLNVRLEIDFVSVRSFEYQSFKAIKFTGGGEKLAVLLSPSIFRRIGTGFLNDLRRLSPTTVVYVDAEGHSGYDTPSRRHAVINGLEFYSALLESVEAANLIGAGGWDWMRRIETFVLYPKILEAVEGIGRRGGATVVREALAAAGLRPAVLSQFAEFQAECLLRRVQISGFHLVKRLEDEAMLLCWHNRPLAEMSAWQ